jgi:hypothetical protein
LQHRSRLGFEQDIEMRLGDAFVTQDDVSQHG